MSDYAVIQTVQQLRILVESTVLPLAGLGIIAFAWIRIARIRRGNAGSRDSAATRGIEDRITRLEQAVYSLSARLPDSTATDSIQERVENLEALVVERELNK